MVTKTGLTGLRLHKGGIFMKGFFLALVAVVLLAHAAQAGPVPGSATGRVSGAEDQLVLALRSSAGPVLGSRVAQAGRTPSVAGVADMLSAVAGTRGAYLILGAALLGCAGLLRKISG